jgi:hypothetical protein
MKDTFDQDSDGVRSASATLEERSAARCPRLALTRPSWWLYASLAAGLLDGGIWGHRTDGAMRHRHGTPAEIEHAQLDELRAASIALFVGVLLLAGETRQAGRSILASRCLLLALEIVSETPTSENDHQLVGYRTSVR